MKRVLQKGIEILLKLTWNFGSERIKFLKSMKSFIKRMNQGLLYSNFLWFKISHPVGKFVKTQDVLKGVKRLYPVEKLIKPGGGGTTQKGQEVLWNWSNSVSTFMPKFLYTVRTSDTTGHPSFLDKTETNQTAWKRLNPTELCETDTLQPIELLQIVQWGLSLQLSWAVFHAERSFQFISVPLNNPSPVLL